jgi:hypothetical protein
MSFSSQVKLAAAVLVFSAAAFLSVKYYMAKAEIAELRSQVAQLRQANTAQGEIIAELVEEKRREARARAEAEERLSRLSLDIAKADRRTNEVIRLFEDHDLAELIKKKPGLITKRMRSATRRVFSDFERIANDKGAGKGANAD